MVIVGKFYFPYLESAAQHTHELTSRLLVSIQVILVDSHGLFGAIGLV